MLTHLHENLKLWDPNFIHSINISLCVKKRELQEVYTFFTLIEGCKLDW